MTLNITTGKVNFCQAFNEQVYNLISLFQTIAIEQINSKYSHVTCRQLTYYNKTRVLF